MNIKKIQELIELMGANELTEVEVEQEGTKIRLIKKPSGAIEQHQFQVPAAPLRPVYQEDPRGSEAGGNGPGAASDLKKVAAPMVGTFYRSPSPEEPPYKEVGDLVKKGDVLCIVEAMKLMNEVKAEFGGKVAEICVDNGDPVEFGQAIFMIEPV